jgi:predicted N-formylglutamate amidohydrolase
MNAQHRHGSDRDEAPDLTMVLDPDEPAPALVINPEGRSPFLLVGDHAGSLIPRRLQLLGLGSDDRSRHIALDIGVRSLGLRLADALDATLIMQRYSRLVIDCNRDPGHPDAIPEIVDGTVIPENGALDFAARAARCKAIHQPYQQTIAWALSRRDTEARPTVLVSLHSFTPCLDGMSRPWDIGVLHSEGQTRFASRLLAAFRDKTQLVVGDNEPYRMDETDYTVPHHAFPSARDYTLIEVRHDHLMTANGLARWSLILIWALSTAYRKDRNHRASYTEDRCRNSDE